MKQFIETIARTGKSVTTFIFHAIGLIALVFLAAIVTIASTIIKSMRIAMTDSDPARAGGALFMACVTTAWVAFIVHWIF